MHDSSQLLGGELKQGGVATTTAQGLDHLCLSPTMGSSNRPSDSPTASVSPYPGSKARQILAYPTLTARSSPRPKWSGCPLPCGPRLPRLSEAVDRHQLCELGPRYASGDRKSPVAEVSEMVILQDFGTGILKNNALDVDETQADLGGFVGLLTFLGYAIPSFLTVAGLSDSELEHHQSCAPRLSAQSRLSTAFPPFRTSGRLPIYGERPTAEVEHIGRNRSRGLWILQGF